MRVTSTQIGQFALNRMAPSDVYFNASAEVCGTGAAVRYFGLKKAVWILHYLAYVMKILLSLLTLTFKVACTFVAVYAAVIFIVSQIAAIYSAAWAWVPRLRKRASFCMRADDRSD